MGSLAQSELKTLQPKLVLHIHTTNALIFKNLELWPILMETVCASCLPYGPPASMVINLTYLTKLTYPK